MIMTNDDDCYFASHAATLSSHTHSNLHGMCLQALAPDHHPDWSGKLFFHELEPLFGSDGEEKYPEPHEVDNVFTTQAGQDPFPHMKNSENQHGDSSVGQLEFISNSSYSSSNSFMQSSPLSYGNVANTKDPLKAPKQENIAGFADAWTKVSQQDLSGFSVSRNETMPNCKTNQFFPKYSNRSLQQDIFCSHHVQKEPLIDLGKNVFTPNYTYNTHTGASAAPQCLSEVDTNDASALNVAYLPERLYRADTGQEQSYMSLKNNNLLIPNSLTLGLHQELEYASPQQRNLMQQHQTSYPEEKVVQSRKFRQTAPTVDATSKPNSSQEETIAKPEHRIGSETIFAKFQCRECPELFKSKIYAGRHLQNCHLKKKKFPCMHCSASYGRPGSRTIHMRKAHPECTQKIPASKPIAKEVERENRFWKDSHVCVEEHMPQCVHENSLIFGAPGNASPGMCFDEGQCAKHENDCGECLPSFLEIDILSIQANDLSYLCL